MPGVDGFVVAESLRGPDAPLLVFVTAYDSHAIRAFETRALDYLLKPVREERLATALTRAREALAARRSAGVRERAAQRHRAVSTTTSRRSRLRRRRSALAAARIEVRDGERVRYIDTADVAWAEAHGAHVKLHTKRACSRSASTLARLEASLDARRIRPHPSLVHRERRPDQGAAAVVRRRRRASCCTDGQQLKVSRTYRAQLKQRLNAL